MAYSTGIPYIAGEPGDAETNNGLEDNRLDHLIESVELFYLANNDNVINNTNNKFYFE